MEQLELDTLLLALSAGVAVRILFCGHSSSPRQVVESDRKAVCEGRRGESRRWLPPDAISEGLRYITEPVAAVPHLGSSARVLA